MIDQHSSARLAAIVASSDDAIVSKTLDGVIMSWNPAAERIFGWTEAEVVGKHITLIIPRERWPEEDDVLARIRRGERIDHFETVRVAKDGRLLDISLTVSPVVDASGRIVGASKIARNITEQKRADAARARLAAIVDSSDDAIIGMTLDGVITSWNAAAERMFGWTAEEAVNRHITLIIPKERYAEEDDVLARIRRGERVDHFETVRVAKDGQRLEVSLTVSPVRDDQGHIIGASKIARDITERRRAEEERERLLVRERQARAEAEAANRSKDEFLATVSHELRTPLTAIFGWARMLQTNPSDEAVRQRATEAIIRSAGLQTRLIEDLLDLSRIVTGRMRLDVVPLDLSNVVDAALEAVRPAATAKNVALVAATEPRGVTMMGAPDRLQQVVWNLVMNAVKFTPRGGRVEVTLRYALDTVDIAVADTGEGISPEMLPHVFERFRQEDSTSTRAHGGLGLGLAIVRHLVELHGGHVRAESAGKGKGATFTVTLPLWSTSRIAADVPAPEPAGGAVPRRLEGLRILIVDDDPDALHLSGMILRQDGGDVRTASSAFRAYDIVKSWHPQVLVADLAMPGEDGFMLLRSLRDVFAEHGARLPAIAVTAYANAETMNRDPNGGFDLYLTKPVDPRRLTTAVAEVVGRTD